MNSIQSYEQHMQNKSEAERQAIINELFQFDQDSQYLNNYNQKSFPPTTSLQSSNNNQRSYLGQFNDTDTRLFQILYSQEPVLSSQLQHQSNSHAPDQYHQQHLQKDQPDACRQQKNKKPYKKRSHAFIACISCREARLRCKIKLGAAICDRCHKVGYVCNFNEPKKRGRKPGSKNKPKENATVDTKKCCHSNNESIDDNNLFEGISNILSPGDVDIFGALDTYLYTDPNMQYC